MALCTAACHELPRYPHSRVHLATPMPHRPGPDASPRPPLGRYSAATRARCNACRHLAEHVTASVRVVEKNSLQTRQNRRFWRLPARHALAVQALQAE